MERRLIPLQEVPLQQQQFLWGHRLPIGALTVLDGFPGEGKSILLYDITARLTTGRRLPECQRVVPPCGVVLLQAEDDLGSVVRPRLHAAGADLSRIRVFDRSRFCRDPLTIPGDLALIEAAITEIRARLVVIDPVSEFLEGAMGNEQRIRRSLMPLVEMAHRTQCAVVIVRHPTKSGAGPALYRGAGSVGVVGLARAGLMVGSDPVAGHQFRHVLVQSKTSLGNSPALRYETRPNHDGVIVVEWLGPCQLTADELVASGREQRSQLDEAKYVLFTILSTGPLPAKTVLELAKKAGVSASTLRRAKSAIRVASRKRGSGPDAHWFWQLPDDPAVLQSLHDREMEELMDRLIYGEQTGPPPGLTDRSIDRRQLRREDDDDRSSTSN